MDSNSSFVLILQLSCLKADLLPHKRSFLSLCLIKCFFHLQYLAAIFHFWLFWNLETLSWLAWFYLLFLPRRVDLQVTSRSTINLHKFIIMLLTDSSLCPWRLNTIMLFALSTRSLIDRDICDAIVDVLGLSVLVSGVVSFTCIGTGFVRIALFMDLHFSCNVHSAVSQFAHSNRNIENKSKWNTSYKVWIA